jgi:Tfp pilus assembly protein PilZ
MRRKWCAVCGSRHDLGPGCPGDLQATGSERFGWKIAVEAGLRAEEYGVLIGPCGDIWRARILTFPNMLWSVPGGRGTMKFLGNTAAEAEKRAKEYILGFIRRRGYQHVAPSSQPKVGKIRPEGAPGSPEDRRHLHAVSVRFGEERPDREAKTADLSMTGMFVETPRPLPQGRRLKLAVDLGHVRLPLQATVAWIRTTSEDDRKAGMGLQLHAPPAIYKHYVRELTGTELDEPEPAPKLPGAATVPD